MESFLPVSKLLGTLENAASRTRTRLSGHRASGRTACPVGGGPSPRRPLAYRVQDGRAAELPRHRSIRIVGVADRSLFLRPSARRRPRVLCPVLLKAERQKAF